MARVKKNPLQAIGDTISGAMRRNGYSCHRAAEDIFGCSKPTLDMWLADPKKMPLGVLVTACKEFDIPLETLTVHLQ